MAELSQRVLKKRQEKQGDSINFELEQKVILDPKAPIEIKLSQDPLHCSD